MHTQISSPLPQSIPNVDASWQNRSTNFEGVESTLPQPRTTERPKVLLAEDDPDLRSLMRAFLTHEGYDVLACADGRRALELYQNGIAFDLLLSDVEMPHLNGIELAQTLSASRASLPIILMSGADLPSEIHDRFQSAGWRFFHKPFTLVEMLAAIHSSLPKR